MLTVDQCACIRRLRRDGLTIRQIADQLHHSRGARQYIRVLQLLAQHTVELVERAIQASRHRADADAATITALAELKANLKQLRLPTMAAEWEKLAREAADRDESCDAYLLRLTELEVAARSANAVTARIRAAAFPVLKDFDAFDFTAAPRLPKQQVLELARGAWLEQHYNCCLIGGSGTGKTHLATALGLALCRLGRRVKFITAAALVTQLEAPSNSTASTASWPPWSVSIR